MKNRKWTAKEIIDHAVTGRKPKDSIQPAHMAGQDYDHTHHCAKCGKPDRIIVRYPMHWALTMFFWKTRLAGKCKDCIEEGKAMK